MTLPYKQIQCIETGNIVYTFNPGAAVCEHVTYVHEWSKCRELRDWWDSEGTWAGYQIQLAKDYPDLVLTLGSIYEIKIVIPST